MPQQAGPVPDRGPGHPLALGEDARARLGGAVHTLLELPGLEGASDAVRLAVIVLASRTPVSSGVVEIRTRELGRWLGLSASYVASVVLPALRRSGTACVEPADGEFGEVSGLTCRVLPLRDGRGVVGHPLNLTKKEFATLLRLLEAVMAPGWRHRDGTVTPAGLLGSRTGRGAATDRLALLLLVLQARESGRVRQCGGAVPARRGRAAATLARMLGCTASAGERVLERLEEQDVVRRVRLRTGSGLAQRSRLMVPAVAAAHGRMVPDNPPEARTTARGPVFSDPDVTAGPDQTPETRTEPQVTAAAASHRPETAGPDATAALHTDHSPVAEEGGEAEGSGGFSGGTPSGTGGLPGRAGVRENGTGRKPAGRVAAAGGLGGALRAEEHTTIRLPHLKHRALLGRVAAGLPQTAGVLAGLAGLAGRTTAHQRRLLDRLLGGLLAEGEDDAMIASRLRERLAPLATGVPGRPYRFRRDGVSWALSIGLPYQPGDRRTLVPCAVPGCRGRVRGRVTDLRIRCDRCELAALERQEPGRARRALEAALAAPLPLSGTGTDHASGPPEPAGEGAEGPAPTAAVVRPGTAELPSTVREQLDVLAAADPAAGRRARQAAEDMYTPAGPDEDPDRYRERLARATATWSTVSARYAGVLTAHYAQAAGSAA